MIPGMEENSDTRNGRTVIPGMEENSHTSVFAGSVSLDAAYISHVNQPYNGAPF